MANPSMTRTALLAAAAAMTLIAPAAVFADVITMTNGTQLSGAIDDSTARSATVMIRTSGGSMALPKSRIKSIEQESPAMDKVRLGDGLMQADRAAEALLEYQGALKIEPGLQAAKDGEAKALSETARTEAARKQAAVSTDAAKLDQVERLAKEKKFDEAYSLLKGMETGLSPDLKPRYDQLVRDGAYQWAVDSLDRQNPVKAVRLLEFVLRVDPQNEAARKKLVAIYEKDPTKLDKVIEANKDSTDPEEIARTGDALYRQQKYVEALETYKKVAAVPSVRTPQRMDRVRQALDHVHTDLARKGDYAGAIRVYKSMPALFPDLDPVMLARYECRLEASKTDMKDADAVIGLARYVESRGFTSNARDLYVKALELKPGQPAALESLNRLAAVDLGDLASLMNDAQYPLAVAKASEIARTYSMLPATVQQANAMAAQAKEMAAKMVAEAQRQAQLYAERGDTYYQQAQSYLSMYYSTETDTRVRVVSPKEETVKYLRLALTAWQYALQLDASTGSPLSFDLNRKVAEASSLLSRLSSTSVYMPRYELQ